ncbi:hypothetical protein BCR32DRAFT_282148 [Anaeromyces robustus]|uniref:Uncharacterized protein n=1 Tax=Anaeromyces robustus TaxID=1754192 RepID=A0A1Y1WYD3_9FUNG|nr:hypothetical protein BCR32DRAFT_282148 [Anaeromyces robustus]|eukprot:ORX78589.1 hypothetical protein BCR32DRAFT_282148 [Anaeromyces robustus]
MLKNKDQEESIHESNIEKFLAINLKNEYDLKNLEAIIIDYERVSYDKNKDILLGH